MGCTVRDGPAHKIKTCGTRHRSAYTARLPEDILKIKVDLIGYYRYCNTYYIADYDTFLVTLPL
jgi:hypothetical protein